MELRLLRSFVEVAGTEHVGRAAARLHISQSPLSRQMRALEDALGLRLFERHGRRIRLTADGRWLLVGARDLLGRAEGLEREARERAGGVAGELRIGFVGAALQSGVLPAALRRLRDERPRVAIVLRQLASRDQLEAVRAGELDLALVHREARAADLDDRVVIEQPYVLAVPARGPLARGALPAARLDGQPWIAVTPGEGDRDRWTAAWSAAGLTPGPTVQVSNWTSALALVDAGVGAALIPESYATPTPPGVRLRRPPWLRLTSTLALVRRPGGGAPLRDTVAAWILAAGQAERPRRATRPMRQKPV